MVNSADGENFSLRAARVLTPRVGSAGTGTLRGLWTQHRAKKSHKSAHLHFHTATEQGEVREQHKHVTQVRNTHNSPF